MQWRFATQHESNFSSSSTMWKFFHDHQVGHARKFSKIVLFFYTDQNFYRLLYYGQKYLPTFLLPTKISTEFFSKNTIITVTINFDPREYHFHLNVAFRQFTEQFITNKFFFLFFWNHRLNSNNFNILYGFVFVILHMIRETFFYRI